MEVILISPDGGAQSLREVMLLKAMDMLAGRVISILEGPPAPKQDFFLACNCLVCSISRMFLQHKAATKSIENTAYSKECLCHFCTAKTLGDPDRPLFSPDCICSFCANYRRIKAADAPAVHAAEDEPDESSESEEPCDCAGCTINRRLANAVMQRDAINTTSAPVEAQEQNQGEELVAKIKQLEKAFGKKFTQVGPVKALPPSTQRKEEEEKEPMPTQKQSLVDGRKMVDIGGKEMPVFETKGTKIAVPEGMHKLEAAEWLIKQHNEEQQMVAVNEEIKGFPLDAAVALFKALNKHFGWTDLGAVPSWFGDIPPALIAVATGVNETVQVPWGRIMMPGIEDGYIQWSPKSKSDGQLYLHIGGQVKKKDRETISKIVKDARSILIAESIYKGKAIKVTFPEYDPDNNNPLENMPTFYDTSKIDPTEVVFAESVREQIEVSLFTPIRQTEACRKFKIPLKRTVLFAGTYGVGKTLTAAVTAKEAVDHNWTFIMPKSAEDLHSSVEFARQYEPAVIFVEDIDSVVKGERSVDMDHILNVIDGVESKGREIMIVLTTNHPELINKAMLRPGRVDALIEVVPPDAKAAERLLRIYARELIDADEDLTEVGILLQGNKPATIREVIERAKLAAISERGVYADKVQARDLVTAFHIMKPHLELMAEKKVEEKVTLDALLKTTVREALVPDTMSPTNGAKKQDARA